MKYKKCEIEYTDEPSNFEIKATSFYVQAREKKKSDYNRAKDERNFWKREEREF